MLILSLTNVRQIQIQQWGSRSTIDQFVTSLRLSTKSEANEMIRDRIAFGTISVEIRQKLIN